MTWDFQPGDMSIRFSLLELGTVGTQGFRGTVHLGARAHFDQSGSLVCSESPRKFCIGACTVGGP